MLGERHCAECGQALPDDVPLIARYCSKSCKWKADAKRRSEYVKSYQEAYRLANAERLRDWQANYRARNRAALSAKTKREYAKNPLPWKNARDRRRAQIRSASETRIVTSRDWQRMLLAYRHCCAYCGASGDMTMDHVVPVSRGGRHAIGNLVPACLPCNLAKNAMFLFEWKLKTRRREVGDAVASLPARRGPDARLGSPGLDNGEPLSA
ncbi:HNH endonuclease [Streptomyces sp. enrichment culture]|uniref:HNH endonuclease n=1 Tax=Streptomyces sp. enrichment culture TaxID=1795815 RepID=UPI003F561926